MPYDVNSPTCLKLRKEIARLEKSFLVKLETEKQKKAETEQVAAKKKAAKKQKKAEKAKKKGELRKGKWSKEEEEYTQVIINAFQIGKQDYHVYISFHYTHLDLEYTPKNTTIYQKNNVSVQH